MTTPAEFEKKAEEIVNEAYRTDTGKTDALEAMDELPRILKKLIALSLQQEFERGQKEGIEGNAKRGEHGRKMYQQGYREGVRASLEKVNCNCDKPDGLHLVDCTFDAHSLAAISSLLEGKDGDK